MIIYPALDLRGGRIVRLEQGDYDRETDYRHDAVTLARAYATAGARWLHVVDLDGARDGRSEHRTLVGRIVDATGVSVQSGGGVRDEAGVEALLVGGVSRVVVGSLAVREPALVQSWLQRFGAERICVALDARADASGAFQLPVTGWTEASGVTLFDLLDNYVADGALKHVLCTDIELDGMMRGLNLSLYRALAERYPQLAFQASGGVRGLDDIRAVRETGVAGVVVGKALLEGRLTVDELLAC